MSEEQLNEKAEIFESNWGESPIVSVQGNTIVVKLYNVRRVDMFTKTVNAIPGT